MVSGNDFPKKKHSARVAQLDRVLGYEPGGRRFESSRAHHYLKAADLNVCCCNRISARVAQLDRVLGYEPGGRRFESSRAHHHLKAQLRLGFFYTSILFPLSLSFSRYHSIAYDIKVLILVVLL